MSYFLRHPFLLHVLSSSSSPSGISTTLSDSESPLGLILSLACSCPCYRRRSSWFLRCFCTCTGRSRCHRIWSCQISSVRYYALSPSLSSLDAPSYHVGESLIPSVRHYFRYIGAEAILSSYGFVSKASIFLFTGRFFCNLPYLLAWFCHKV